MVDDVTAGEMARPSVLIAIYFEFAIMSSQNTL